MKEIFELLQFKDPVSAAKMTVYINNEETTIFLGIDASEEESFILFHNVKVIPASSPGRSPPSVHCMVLARPPPWSPSNMETY